MASKKESTTKKTEDKKQEVDISELVAKAVADALSESEKKHKKELEKIKDEKIKNNSFDDLTVEIMNNTHSTFIMSGRKGKSANIFYKLESYGDTAILEYEEFRNYYSQNSKRFKSGELIITDVIGNVELDDLLERIRLISLYEGKLSFKDYDSILQADYKKFIKFVEDNPETFDNLLEHAVQLQKKGKFNEADKQSFFRNGMNMPELFK